MSDLTETNSSSKKRNPLFWIGLIVIGLIVFIVFGSDRGTSVSKEDVVVEEELVGEIDRDLLVPPGLRARELVEQLRTKGGDYPLDMVYAKAKEHHAEGSLADAHLLYFFAAREGHTQAMMTLAEMSDPTIFRAEDTLLDQADAVQSYKWYQKVSEQGESIANDRIRNLREWAIQESENGNPRAHQFLLLVD